MNTEFKFEHGTEEEHRGTAARAKENDISYIWSGTIRSSPYLRENLEFIQHFNLATLTYVECEQESGWEVDWK